MRTPAIDAETFVRIWQRARSLEEVTEKTGYSKAVASQRAARLRSGTPKVELQSFVSCGRCPLDRVALARLARRLAR